MTVTWTEQQEVVTWEDQEAPGVTWETNVGPVTIEGVGGVTDHGALTGLSDNDHPQYQLASEKNNANGYPRLDGSGTIPDSQIPASIARDTEVDAAITTHAGAADPHGDRAFATSGLSTKADLVAGKVPANQLPAFVDDIVEAANFAALPGTGETGKLYVTLDTNVTYRWSGSAYVEVSASLALGETSSTAHRGDRGKTAYDHSQATGNPHGTTIDDISGLQDALDAAGGTPEIVTVYFALAGNPEVDGTATEVSPLLPDGTTFPIDPDFLAGATAVFAETHADKTAYTITARPDPWTPIPVQGGQPILAQFPAMWFEGWNTEAGGSVDPSQAADRIVRMSADKANSADLGTAATHDADEFAAAADLDDLTTRYEQQFPTSPVKPNHHRSKFVTFDPGGVGAGPENHHLLDGTATHVGGHAIEDGQNLTVADNANGHGGIWELHLGSPATVAGGLGSVPGALIANYDLVDITGTLWAQETTWRLLGHNTERGISEIFGAYAVTRGSFRPCLIATDLTGSNLTVMDRDGTSTVVDVETLEDICDVLVLDNLTLVTIEDGEVKETEDFSSAEGVFAARGLPGVAPRDHAGTTVAVMGGRWALLSESAPLDPDLTAVAELSPSNDDFLQRKSGAWTNRTVAQVLADLGLASLYQPLDADLTALAGNGAPGATGLALLLAANAAAARSTLGITAGFGQMSQAGGSTTIAANDAYFVRCVVPSSGTINRIRVRLGASSGNIDVGLYADDGTGEAPGTRLVSSGSVASPGTGVRWVSVAETAVTAGDIIWIAVAADNTTVSFYWGSNADAVNIPHRPVRKASSFPLPSSVSSTSTTTVGMALSAGHT